MLPLHQKLPFAFMCLAALLCCVISSCGYHLGQGEGITTRYATISVPYIEGDADGSLTAAVIKQIANSGAFEYRNCGGSLILNIDLVDIREENIGFRYYRKKRGELTRDIVPTETRMIAIVEMEGVDASTGCTVLGPVRLSAYVDYDHDYYLSRNGVNIFSLGQLTDLEEAYDAVQTPLHHLLAQKIVDYVSQSW